MFLKKLDRLRQTLAFRLTLWYAGVFLVMCCAAFLLFYLVIGEVIREGTDQDLLEKARSLSSVSRLRGVGALRRQVVIEAQAAGERKIFFRLLYPTGQVFSSSNMSYWRDIAVGEKAIRHLLETNQPVFETIRAPDRNHQVRLLYALIDPTLVIQLGQSLESSTRIVEAFQRIFIVTMAALLAAAAAVGWFMARRALVGVATVTRTARRISGGSLRERVPAKMGNDEMDQLAGTFNQMLDRIETLVTGIKDMSDNIAHDLKSPITRIRGSAEVTLTTAAGLNDYELMAAGIIEECDRLLEMINTMLLISRTEAGVEKLDATRIDLADVVRNACELFRSLADDRSLTMSCSAPRSCEINGDVRLLQRMLANLLDNAIKYTAAGGRIDVCLRPEDDRAVVVSVRDSGYGIDGKDLPNIFERFYRADPSRSETGAGLGLSLARAVARAHGGDIRVESVENQGSVFRVILPRTRRT
jgi:heavy metal sensor kinase